MEELNPRHYLLSCVVAHTIVPYRHGRGVVEPKPRDRPNQAQKARPEKRRMPTLPERNPAHQWRRDQGSQTKPHFKGPNHNAPLLRVEPLHYIFHTSRHDGDVADRQPSSIAARTLDARY